MRPGLYESTGIDKYLIVFQMLQPGNTDGLEPISLSCLVELSVVAPSGQEQIGDDMKNFAEQLKPYPFTIKRFR